jgi:hypothetical protein
MRNRAPRALRDLEFALSFREIGGQREFVE